ncbi:MAG: hypothetical protein LQ341_004582 [Variospora aurantia]|nr:MAG: hypothetical protein LQ341_004582 [Variospora aurantia]
MDAIGTCVAIAQITPAIIRYVRAVKTGAAERRQLLLEVTSTSGIVQLLHNLAQETSSEDPWAPSLESMGELIGQYQSLLEELAHTLDPARKSRVDALKWPFEKKAVVETLTNLEYYKTAFLTNETFNRRDMDTGDWVLQEPTFQSWAFGNLSSIYCEGIPGAGKTIIAAIVIGHLRSQRANNVWTGPSLGSSVTCLYCTYKEREGQTTENLLGSIIRQLTESHPKKFVPSVRDFSRNRKEVHEKPLLDNFVSMLVSMLRCFQRSYIVVDALDECTEETRDSLLTSLDKLQQLCDLKIISHSESKETLTDYAISKILSRSQGMFLLARLHLESVARSMTEATVKARLDRLPRQLNATYDEAMHRVHHQDEEHAELAKKVLAWILYASRSLTMLELQHALVIANNGSNQSIDDEQIIKPEDIISSCAGIITMDQKTNVVRMVHYSAQEYFSTNRQTHFPNGHREIADVCLGYLGSEQFSHERYGSKDQMDTRLKQTPFFGYAARYWGHHVRESGANEALTRNTLRFLGLKSNLSCATHVGMHGSLGRPWNDYLTGAPVPPPLIVAAYFGLHDVTLALLDQGADINDLLPYPDGTGVSALDLASQKGFSQVVQVLLDAGSDPRKALQRGISAIHRASANNHPGIVAILLKHDRELVKVRNIYGKTALMDAAERGFADTLDVLLQAGSDPCDKDNNKATPLSLAAASGSRPTVQLLLDAGAPVNFPIPGAKQAIYAAAFKADQAMLELLLEKGADVECRGAVNNNVLHGAVCGADNPSIIGIIINDAIRNHKVSPVLNARNVLLKSPLHDAVERNRLRAVAIMLEHDPEMEPDIEGRTPLHWAVFRNLVKMTGLLLRSPRGRACINQRAGPKFKERTALEMAVDKQYIELIKMLSEAL